MTFQIQVFTQWSPGKVRNAATVLTYKISPDKALDLVTVKSERVTKKLLSLSYVISMNSVFMKTMYRLLVH